MQSFSFVSPTSVILGKNCIFQNQDLIASFGRKAFIISSRFTCGCENLALKDIAAVLNALEIDYTVFEDAEENPSVESVASVAKEIRSFAPDFLIGIGGGSALDTAKAANVLLRYPADQDPYEVLYGKKQRFTPVLSDGLLPMIAMPTTAGSGSDTAGCAVLTRSDTDTKLSMFHRSYYNVSFLDVKYIQNSPQFLLDSGAMDTLAHGIESYLSVRASETSRNMAAYGLRLFAEFKDDLLARSLTEDDMEKMLTAASFQGIVVMMTSTTIPHGMGYPLSHFKNVNHGMSCIIFLGEFLRELEDKQAVKEVLTLCGFSDLEEFCAYIRALAARNLHFTVTEKDINAWTDGVMLLKARFENVPERISRDAVLRIYRTALAPYMLPAEKEADISIHQRQSA